MGEAITLICVIAIVGPLLALLVMGYNINQKLKGLPEKDGGAALMDIWRQLWNQFQTGSRLSQEKPKLKNEKTKKTAQAQSKIEDAEFYEKKS
jgi:hypothetical protein